MLNRAPYSAASGLAGRQLDRRRARVAARAIAERRRHARVGLPLQGRMMHADGREFACEITNVSTGGLLVAAPKAPRVNSRVVLHAEPLGRLEGVAIRVRGETFALRFEAMTDRRRARLADTLIWEINHAALELEDDRRARRRGKTGAARVVLSDGVETRADYIDVSDAGASFASLTQPRPGERALVESRAARVARTHERGFAVDYAPCEPDQDENKTRRSGEKSKPDA